MNPGSSLDREVPTLLAKIGSYPQHHGGLGVVRTIGRMGVPVHAVVEDRFTPVAVSRHVTRRFVWPTTGLEEPRLLIETLLSIGRAIGSPCIPVPTDDEMASCWPRTRTGWRSAFCSRRRPPVCRGCWPARQVCTSSARSSAYPPLAHGHPQTAMNWSTRRVNWAIRWCSRTAKHGPDCAPRPWAAPPWSATSKLCWPGIRRARCPRS